LPAQLLHTADRSLPATGKDQMRTLTRRVTSSSTEKVVSPKGRIGAAVAAALLVLIFRVAFLSPKLLAAHFFRSSRLSSFAAVPNGPSW